MYNGDLEQIRLRLQGTVIMYDSRPVIVSQIAADKIGLAFLPTMRDVFFVPFDDPKLNIREFRLGYVNVNRSAMYVQRFPGRQQRQGLCGANVKLGQRGGIPWNDLIRRAEFTDMMRNVYPTFAQVVDRLEKNPELNTMAFNRRFALAKDQELGFFELHYRGRRIAWGDPSNFNLPSDHQYLAEVIAAEGISVR
jgi:hypothetical protein